VLLAGEPEARVIGEELNPEIVTEGLVWIVDPLDGTTNFLHGFPSYAVSIAAAVDGSVQAGVVLDVCRNTAFSASLNGGAWMGEERVKVSAIDDPEFALIGTGFPFRDMSGIDEYQKQSHRWPAARAAFGGQELRHSISPTLRQGASRDSGSSASPPGILLLEAS
jgi:myo-inositol-1(or 4)-monophosphatase